MTDLVVGIVIPVASVLIGAAITYWLNVRAQSRRDIEKLFRQAIIAVKIAVASQTYLRGYAQTENMTPTDHKKLLSSIDSDAIMNNIRRTEEAQYAIAQVSQYEPRLEQYIQDPNAILGHSSDVIALLEVARDSRLKYRKRRVGAVGNALTNKLLGESIKIYDEGVGHVSCPARSSGSVIR